MDSAAELCVFHWLTSVATVDLRGQRLCELRGQRNRTTRLCSMFSKCPPSCKINIPKFSSRTPRTQNQPPTRPSLPAAKSGIIPAAAAAAALVVEDKTQICVGTLWCLVSSVLNCIGADTYLMSASASLPENPRRLLHNCQQERRREQPDCFISSSQITILPTLPTLSLPLYHPLPVTHTVCVCALTRE